MTANNSFEQTMEEGGSRLPRRGHGCPPVNEAVRQHGTAPLLLAVSHGNTYA